MCSFSDQSGEHQGVERAPGIKAATINFKDVRRFVKRQTKTEDVSIIVILDIGSLIECCCDLF